MKNQNAMKQDGKKGWKTPFFTLWVGQAFSLLGSSLVGFALVWYLTMMTGSATVLAIASIMEWLPRVIAGPFAGVLVDRWNRRLVMISADTLTALATGAIILLGWLGILEVWHIYLLMLVRSLGGSFHLPAMLASTSLMVPENQLARIQGLNQLLQGVLNIVAPVLGAVLVEFLPLHSVLALDLGTAALAVMILAFIKIPQPEVDPTNNPAGSSIWTEMRDGFRYVWNWSGLKKILILAVLINAISMPAIVLLPLLVRNEFGGQAMEIASMQSSWAVGFLLGGLLLSTWGGFRNKVLTASLAMLGSGIGMLIVGVAPGHLFLVAVSGILIAGLMNVLMNGPAFALLQTIVEANMQGRVMSLVISLANAITPLSLVFAGPLSEQLGIRTWFFLTCAVFTFSGVFALVDRDIRSLDQRSAGELAEMDGEPAQLIA
jgi:DHA3 family macrolide efflux protein-like MFS transporter